MAAHTQIFRNVCSFGPLVNICDILFSEVIRLESAEVSENCPTVGKNLQIFVPQNVGDTDRAPSDLRYKIRPYTTFRHHGKGAAGQRSSASKIRARKNN